MVINTNAIAKAKIFFIIKSIPFGKLRGWYPDVDLYGSIILVNFAFFTVSFHEKPTKTKKKTVDFYGKPTIFIELMIRHLYARDFMIKDTGEEMDTEKALVLDVAKISEEEKYDGYYSIVTSEREMSDMEIRDMYKGLWEIEETFRVTKRTLGK